MSPLLLQTRSTDLTVPESERLHLALTEGWHKLKGILPPRFLDDPNFMEVLYMAIILGADCAEAAQTKSTPLTIGREVQASIDFQLSMDGFDFNTLSKDLRGSLAFIAAPIF